VGLAREWPPNFLPPARCQTATALFCSDKSPLNLHIDFPEPLFSALALLLVKLSFSLEFRDPLFSRAKLVRKLLRHVEREP
jgi:hypothetical protein